jgi:predicted nucleotidyltransferase
MVTLNETIFEKRNTQITSISAIAKRLEQYKNFTIIPFLGKIPFILDFILGNEYKQYIQKIYLFGSYAYGEPNEDSDIDLCVIIDDDKPWLEVTNCITKKLWNEKIVPCDVLVFNASLFYDRIKTQSIERVIKKYGILIYERK